jgi:hypothetical protein
LTAEREEDKVLSKSDHVAFLRVVGAHLDAENSSSSLRFPGEGRDATGGIPAIYRRSLA